MPIVGGDDVMVEAAKPVRTVLGYYGTCFYCCRTRVYLTRDHVVPTSRGGAKRKANIVWACRPCNAFKGDRLLTELPEGWPETAVRLLARLDRPPVPRYYFDGPFEPGAYTGVDLIALAEETKEAGRDAEGDTDQLHG